MCPLGKLSKNDTAYSFGKKTSEEQGKFYLYHSELQQVHMWHVYLDIHHYVSGEVKRTTL